MAAMDSSRWPSARSARQGLGARAAALMRSSVPPARWPQTRAWQHASSASLASTRPIPVRRTARIALAARFARRARLRPHVALRDTTQQISESPITPLLASRAREDQRAQVALRSQHRASQVQCRTPLGRTRASVARPASSRPPLASFSARPARPVITALPERPYRNSAEACPAEACTAT